MKFSSIAPTLNDLGETNPEEFFWVRGGNFNREVMVRANFGVSSRMIDDDRRYSPELNFAFYCGGLPDFIWASDLHKYNLDKLEWAGPVPALVEDEMKVDAVETRNIQVTLSDSTIKTIRS